MPTTTPFFVTGCAFLYIAFAIKRRAMFVEGMVRYQLIPPGPDAGANAAAAEIPPAYDEAATPLVPPASVGVGGVAPPSYGSISPTIPVTSGEFPQEGWDGPPKDPYPDGGQTSPPPPDSGEDDQR